jgi:hypothetical protein
MGYFGHIAVKFDVIGVVGLLRKEISAVAECSP